MSTTNFIQLFQSFHASMNLKCMTIANESKMRQYACVTCPFAHFIRIMNKMNFRVDDEDMCSSNLVYLVV